MTFRHDNVTCGSLRRVGALVGTVLVAVAIGHVFLVSTRDESLVERDQLAPRATCATRSCTSTSAKPTAAAAASRTACTRVVRCARPTARSTVAHMLIERVPVDVLLLAVGAVPRHC